MKRRLLTLLTALSLVFATALLAACARRPSPQRLAGELGPRSKFPPRFRIRVAEFRGGVGYEKHGFIDSSGKVVIPPTFDDADDFSEGLAHVWVGDRQAYIDTAGAVRFYLPADCADAGYFSEGLALVNVGGASEHHLIEGGRWGYVRRDGQLVIPPQFSMPRWFGYDWSLGPASHFSEGLAAVPNPRAKLGFIDRTGRWVIEPRYDDAGPFRGGLARVMARRDGGRGRGDAAWGYIDRTGRVIWWTDAGGAEGIPKNPLRHHPPRYLVRTGTTTGAGGDLRYGFIDDRGRVVVPLTFNRADEFSGGLAHVRLGTTHAFIDADGQIVFHLPEDCTDAGRFSEGLAWFGVLDPSTDAGGDGTVAAARFGYVDRTGRVVIEPAPRTATGGDEDLLEFREGRAAMPGGNGKWGFIDRAGRWAIPPQFDEVRLPFQDGLAKVEAADAWGYIDRTGRFVWRTGPVLK